MRRYQSFDQEIRYNRDTVLGSVTTALIDSGADNSIQLLVRSALQHGGAGTHGPVTRNQIVATRNFYQKMAESMGPQSSSAKLAAAFTRTLESLEVSHPTAPAPTAEPVSAGNASPSPKPETKSELSPAAGSDAPSEPEKKKTPKGRQNYYTREELLNAVMHEMEQLHFLHNETERDNYRRQITGKFAQLIPNEMPMTLVDLYKVAASFSADSQRTKVGKWFETPNAVAATRNRGLANAITRVLNREAQLIKDGKPGSLTPIPRPKNDEDQPTITTKPTDETSAGDTRPRMVQLYDTTTGQRRFVRDGNFHAPVPRPPREPRKSNHLPRTPRLPGHSKAAQRKADFLRMPEVPNDGTLTRYTDVRIAMHRKTDDPWFLEFWKNLAETVDAAPQNTTGLVVVNITPEITVHAGKFRNGKAHGIYVATSDLPELEKYSTEAKEKARPLTKAQQRQADFHSIPELPEDCAYKNYTKLRQALHRSADDPWFKSFMDKLETRVNRSEPDNSHLVTIPVTSTLETIQAGRFRNGSMQGIYVTEESLPLLRKISASAKQAGHTTFDFPSRIKSKLSEAELSKKVEFTDHHYGWDGVRSLLNLQAKLTLDQYGQGMSVGERNKLLDNVASVFEAAHKWSFNGRYTLQKKDLAEYMRFVQGVTPGRRLDTKALAIARFAIEKATRVDWTTDMERSLALSPAEQTTLYMSVPTPKVPLSEIQIDDFAKIVKAPRILGNTSKTASDSLREKVKKLHGEAGVEMGELAGDEERDGEDLLDDAEPHEEMHVATSAVAAVTETVRPAAHKQSSQPVRGPER